MTQPYHIPVMLRETISWLIGDPSGAYVDLTFGGGGHARAVIEAIGDSGGRLFGFDADPEAIRNAGSEFAGQAGRTLVLRQAYFSGACRMLADEGIRPAGVLMDLGVSGRQLDSDQIGLSYRQTMPLDMRFNPGADRPSARDLVEGESDDDLATMFRRYGEEPAAWKIARAIVASRRSSPIRTTTDLRGVIAGVIPDQFLVKTLSRVFQALRIAVNDELRELQTALEAVVPMLAPRGRIVVLSYHSLEDRMVKEAFRVEEGARLLPDELGRRHQIVQRLKILTRKPLVPSAAEITENPRSRSAKLRVAEKIEPTHY